jgi:hypothetical protein
MGNGRGGGGGGRSGATAYRRPDLIAFEQRIVAQDPRSEYAFSVSANGEVTWEERGRATAVPLPAWAYEPGATSTHYHPGRGAYGNLSDRDVALALVFGMNLRAFWGTPAGGVGRAEVHWPTPPTREGGRYLRNKEVRPMERQIARARSAYTAAHPLPLSLDQRAYYRAAYERGAAFLREFVGARGAAYRRTP